MIKSTYLHGLALAAGLFSAGLTSAFTLEEFRFDTPDQEEQFRELIGKLRCLVCQNESLAGSQAELAQDLREEVYAMMHAGQSQDEILKFLIERYGDFVLYEPPVKPSTYVLWFGPFVLIGLSAVFMTRALLRKKAAPDQPIDAPERERLRRLLADDTQPDENPS